MGRGVIAALCTALTAVVVPTAASASPRDDYFARLAAAVRTGLDAAITAHGQSAVPLAPLVPPVPIKPRWKASRLGTLDLGAPLVALTAGDLDADGKGELYAVTSREVIAFGVVDRKLKELGRAAFGGARAVPSPRDVVGTAVVDGGELVASVSTWATELRIGWHAKALVAQAGAPGFLVCPGERVSLVPGRNHFGDAAAPLYGVRCRHDLVDPAGHPLRVRAALTANKLEVIIERCGDGRTACQPVARHELKDYGVAFEIADVDRDGKPEIIVSGAGAPGDPDAVKVLTLGGDEKRGLFRRTFTGGVAGLAVFDGDGDGAPEVVAAVRLLGATRVDLWRLD